jgi:hypothetical protein
MNGSRVEIGHVGIRFGGGNWQSQRAERIARMTFQQVQRLISQSSRSGSQRAIDLLKAGTVRVSKRRSDDEIAGAAAAEIYRSLMRG